VRVIVCALGGEEHPWSLPASRIVERTWIHGGERSLYELAVAASVLGHEVELRGDISGTDLRELCEAAGAAPRVGLAPRRPEPEDVVVVPEGWTDPVAYARVALSPARAVLLLLGPPGLVGWPFLPDWSPKDPSVTPVASVARPESFRAMAALGFELWADSAGLTDAARRAGVDCTDIGHGSPMPLPEPAGKTHDVATVEQNRWAPAARRVVDKLDASHLAIPECRQPEVLRHLARARILVWPSRLEGRARITAEARAVGTVPVAIDSNPFAAPLDEDNGAVVVRSLEEMSNVIRELLAQPHRLVRLSRSGMRTARQEGEWEAYLKQVEDALSRPAPEDPSRGARAGFGGEIDARLRQAQREVDEARGRERALDEEIVVLRGRRSVRLALKVAGVARPWFALKERRARRP
jgi:glycosyltransferase involved in cell wall biosynthesis